VNAAALQIRKQFGRKGFRELNDHVPCPSGFVLLGQCGRKRPNRERSAFPVDLRLRKLRWCDHLPGESYRQHRENEAPEVIPTAHTLDIGKS
jgi:hypothetical protein